MSGHVTPATAALDRAHVGCTVHEYDAGGPAPGAPSRGVAWPPRGVRRAGGRRGLQVEVAPADLVRLTGATVAPIAR